MYEGLKTDAYAVPTSTTLNGGVTLTGNADRDVAPISRQMGVVQKLIAVNLELAATVEQRLHAVLRPTGPQNAGETLKDPRSPNAPLTSDLETFRAQLEQLEAHYNDILSRLEV